MNRTFTNPRWADVRRSMIAVEIDGVSFYVPDDMNNRDRREIADTGLVIADYGTPPSN